MGLLLTLTGLYFTFRQAKKAATAADAATEAVREFRFRVNFQDASRDISEAAYALDTTRRHLNNGAWRDAVDSYEDARRAIIRIDIALPNLAPEHQNAIRRASEQMRRFCDKIDAAMAGKAEFPDPAKAQAVIRRNYELLALIQRTLEESVSP